MNHDPGVAQTAQRLDDGGRRVLVLALREALSNGNNYIGPEHLRGALDRYDDEQARRCPCCGQVKATL